MKNLVKTPLDGESGSTLIEIVVATAIVGSILTAIALSLTYTIKLNLQSQARALALKKAQETIDLFRRERTVLGWNNFVQVLDHNQTYCVDFIPTAASEDTMDHIFDDDEDGVSLAGAGSCAYNVVTDEVPIDFKREAYVEFDPAPPASPQTITLEVVASWDNDKSDDDFTVRLEQDFREW